MATINLKNAFESGKSVDKKKLIVISIVVAVLLVILVWFFLGRQQVAGKAIYIEVVEPALAVTGDINAGGTVTVSVDVGSRTMTGATVNIFLPFDCSQVTVRDLFGGLLAGSENSYSCTGSPTVSTLSFDDAILSGTKTGTVPLLELTFTNPTLPMLLQFTRFEIVDGNNRYTVPTLPASFTCRANSCTAGMTVSEAVCGDEIITAPEEVCERDQSQSCTTASGGSGRQMCSSDCSMWGECVPTAVEVRCGDGIVQGGMSGGEQCDGTNLNQATCASVLGNVAATGTLSCTSSCIFDTSSCEVTVEIDDGCPEERTCPEVNAAAVTTFCNANEQNQAACRNICSTLGVCIAAGGGGTTVSGYTVDINGDNTIDGKDAFIILKIAEAMVRSECGASAQAPCGPYSGTYTCDNGDFRVEGYKRYNHREGIVCTEFVDTAVYINEVASS